MTKTLKSAFLLWSTLLCALLLCTTETSAAKTPPKTQTLTFSGTATPEAFYVPVYTCFRVPKGIAKITVEQQVSTPAGGSCNMDLGIFDQRGAGFEGPGFRGWSGGARRTFEISASEATPGYLPGRIEAGEWTVIQMPTTLGKQIDWKLEITLTEGKPGEAFSPTYATPKLNDKPAWYRIAPHVHSVHSDGRLSPREIVALGKASGLDGIISTDHNTTSCLSHWGDVQDSDFLVVNGMEVTYGQGHWNIIGLDPQAWVDFRFHHTDSVRYHQAVAAARSAGELLVANHPYNLDFLHDVTAMDGIEVWNSAWSPANERAVTLWNTLLTAGCRKFAVASTDFHRGDNIASPHTVVRAENLSADAVIRAIAAGHSYLAEDTSIEIGLELRNVATPAMRADIGETLPRRGQVTAEFCTNTPGKLRMIDQQGCFSETAVAAGSCTIPIPEGSLWTRAELRAADGGMLALTNPIYIRHSLTEQPLLPENRHIRTISTLIRRELP